MAVRNIVGSDSDIVIILLAVTVLMRCPTVCVTGAEPTGEASGARGVGLQENSYSNANAGSGKLFSTSHKAR